jgi:hypothetical protein
MLSRKYPLQSTDLCYPTALTSFGECKILDLCAHYNPDASESRERVLVKAKYLKSPCDVFDIVDMLVHIKVSVKWLQGERSSSKQTLQSTTNHSSPAHV